MICIYCGSNKLCWQPEEPEINVYPSLSCEDCLEELPIPNRDDNL